MNSFSRKQEVVTTAGQWREVRRYLNEHRHELAQVADGLYSTIPRVGASRLLCRTAWLPSEPLALDAIELAKVADAPPPAVSGAEPESAGVRAPQPGGKPYRTYAQSVAAIDAPAVFEDRSSYRLLDARLAGHSPRLSFTNASYFDAIDIGEAVAHELAAAVLSQPHRVCLEDLPLRSLVGDPCDPSRRTALLAISTLTLRRERLTGKATFVLHWRDPAKVAHGGGLHQVMPVGVFQPSVESEESQHSDFQLWRCMVREYSEEFLGQPEDYSSGSAALDYDRWPFYRQLTDARQAGMLHVYCVGLGVDPLSLAVDLLAVAVFDDDLFDEIFAETVKANAEGHATIGVPFTADTARRFIAGEVPMQAAGCAVLNLAWRNRGLLLERAS